MVLFIKEKERRVFMKIGNKIYQLRKLSGMTQEQLAEKLNISRQTLSKWENESNMPDIESIVHMSKLFQISLDELLLDEKEEQIQQITLEDLARIYTYNRKMSLLLCTGLLFLVIGILLAAFEKMLQSTTLSLNYLLYRYIVTGQYESAPVDYTRLLIPAIATGIIGFILCACYFIKNKKS